MKKIIKQIKKHEKHLMRAWRFHNFIFIQDDAEDANFYKVSRDGSVKALNDYPLLQVQATGEKIELQGADFMECGDLIFEDKAIINRHG